MKVYEILQETKRYFEVLSKIEDEKERIKYRNKIVELNIKLVPHILKKYKPYSDDMYQEGCIGLIKAVEEYDCTKRVPFCNFACLVIEREIQQKWKKDQRNFEERVNLLELDNNRQLNNSDQIDTYELVEDIHSQEDFDRVIEEDNLTLLFNDIIKPIIKIYGVRAKTLNLKLWKQLELKYIFTLSQEGNNSRRMNYSSMARDLDTSVQNIKNRHENVMDKIKQECIEKDYVL